jgi:hypothetical protein
MLFKFKTWLESTSPDSDVLIGRRGTAGKNIISSKGQDFLIIFLKVLTLIS